MTGASNTQFTAIADFVLNPDLTVPEEALKFTATLLIDTLGVAAGAVALDVATIARDFAVDFHAAGGAGNAAPMLFDGRSVSLPGAAWAAATQIDNLDGHDGYNPTKGHIGVAVVPALFAFAARHPDLSGRDALTALAMSYEVAARAGIALHATVNDYHTSGAWNALGAAALGCRLEGTDTETLRQAMGIAEYHGPRSQMMREIDNPTMLHDGSGMGALIGCSATLLAQRGFQGAPAMTVEAPEVAQYWRDLDQTWTVGLNYIKPYPVCRWAHAALDWVAASGECRRHHSRSGCRPPHTHLFRSRSAFRGHARYHQSGAVFAAFRTGHRAASRSHRAGAPDRGRIAGRGCCRFDPKDYSQRRCPPFRPLSGRAVVRY